MERRRALPNLRNAKPRDNKGAMTVHLANLILRAIYGLRDPISGTLLTRYKRYATTPEGEWNSTLYSVRNIL